jgi:hypothetical protein
MCRRVARAAEPLPSRVAPANAVSPKFAACCRLELQPARAPAAPGPARVCWDWHSGRGEVRTRFGGAALWQEQDEWVARAWLAPDARAAHFLMSGLCALLVHRHGGVLLHAASIVLGSGVLAFIGPSGAGKSTACGQVQGALAFSIDRLAVYPARSAKGTTSWLSHPLPGGTAPIPDMLRATPRWLPLLGILRVSRSEHGTAVASCSLASGVLVLRESAFQAGLGPEAEDELLVALERLGRSVAIGRLQQDLRASSEPVLRRWLLDQARER